MDGQKNLFFLRWYRSGSFISESVSQPAFWATATPYALELCDYCYRLRTSPNNSQLRPHLLPSKATDSDRLLGVVT